MQNDVLTGEGYGAVGQRFAPVAMAWTLRMCRLHTLWARLGHGLPRRSSCTNSVDDRPLLAVRRPYPQAVITAVGER